MSLRDSIAPINDDMIGPADRELRLLDRGRRRSRFKFFQLSRE